MTEKTSHKSTVFKCVVWWAHCVKHIVLVCRAASSCKGWVGVCSTENMGGNRTTDLEARIEGRKSGSERDEVLLSQKVWTQLCSDAHQWKKKIQKGLESGRQRDVLSLCLASGVRQEEAWKMSVWLDQEKDVSVIMPTLPCVLQWWILLQPHLTYKPCLICKLTQCQLKTGWAALARVSLSKEHVGNTQLLTQQGFCLFGVCEDAYTILASQPI